MNNFIKSIRDMRTFIVLWLTQSFSDLGSSMTGYALIIWSYKQEGSALMTALLMICSYAPYVIFSIFAGALSDRWDKKKTMLICDCTAALTTLIVFVLISMEQLELWHIYVINVIGGLMNTVQQPASEVAITKILPKKYYQKVGGLQSLSSSANTILTPVITTAIVGIFGINAVLIFDLSSFAVAFLTLLLFIKIPKTVHESRSDENFLLTVKGGLKWLKKERGIFGLILFLSSINLVASMYHAAFPAMMLSRYGGSEKNMGIVNAVIGLSTLIGSIAASILPTPKSRVRVICNCLLFSMATENIMLALGRNVWVWGLAGFLGWIVIPLMSTNLGAVMRLNIPENIQGRIYAVRNSLQFFTIPLGYFLGGFAVDYICEPVMAKQSDNILTLLFGTGKGSGAALFFFCIAFIGVGICLFFRSLKSIWLIENIKDA